MTANPVVRSLILNLELARRLELAEAQAAVDAARALERLRPDSGAAVEAIAGGFAVYCGVNSPLTQAVGLGLSGVVSEEEFARLEGFYRTRREPIRVETCPIADPSLMEHFGSRGYRATEFTNVMARPIGLKGERRRPPPKGITISKVRQREMAAWAHTVALGFAESHPLTDQMLEVMQAFGSGPNAECYLARVDGQVAGGAALALCRGAAGLFGASTLPAFRGRGVQTALLDRRLKRAAAAGADLAMCLAQPGSTSERNVVRQGFQVLYTRVKFEKETAAKN
jgi:GNAT superfamily N-acetyltransferase